MKMVWNAKLGKTVPIEPPKPARAASKRFQNPSKKPLRSSRGPRNLARGIVNHVSDGAAVHPDDSAAASAHAEAHGHANITYNSEGQMVMRNGSHRQLRKYLKTIGLHDKGSFL